MFRKMALVFGLAVVAHALVSPAQASRMDHNEKGPPPHEVIAKHAERLGIPEEVVGQITSLAKEAREEMKVLMVSLKEENVVLKDLLRSDEVNREAVMAQIDVIGEVEVALRKHKFRVLIEIRQLLTPEQLVGVKALMSTKADTRKDLEEEHTDSD